MYLASTRDDASAAYTEFCKRYEAKYPKAVDCLTKDEDVLFTFYDGPQMQPVLRRDGYSLVAKVIECVRFVDREEQKEAA